MNNDNTIWTIYLHIIPKKLLGTKHDMKYVGLTGRDVDIRWANGRGYSGNKRFFADIKKVGWDNINHDILAQTTCKEEALKIECLYICIFNSRDPEYGYNLMYNSSRNKLADNPNCKPVICLNNLKIYSSAQEAAIITGISHCHITSCCTGKLETAGRDSETDEPLYWKYYDANKTYNPIVTFNTKKGRKILCLETKEIFASVRHAAKKYGVHHSTIARNCNGTATRGGAGKLNDNTILHWKYVDDYIKENNCTFNDILLTFHYADLTKTVDNSFRKIVCLNTLEIFDNISQASELTNISGSSISACIHSKARSGGTDTNGNKLVWMLYDEYKKLSSDEIQATILKAYEHKKVTKMVINVSEGKVFDDQKTAAKYYGIRVATNIGSSILRHVKCSNMIWNYYETYLKENNLTEDEARNSLVFINC